MFMHITDHCPPHPHRTSLEALACEDELEDAAMESAWIRAEERAWSAAFETNEEHRYWTDYEAAQEAALLGV